MVCHFDRPFKFLLPPLQFGGPLFRLPTVSPTYLFFFIFSLSPWVPAPAMPRHAAAAPALPALSSPDQWV